MLWGFSGSGPDGRLRTNQALTAGDGRCIVNKHKRQRRLGVISGTFFTVSFVRRPFGARDSQGEVFMDYDYEEIMKDDRLRVLYNRKVKDWLSNGKTKILKNVDGQAWLVYVTTPPTDSADLVYYDRTLTFTCTEVGSLKSEEDLYEAGLLDVPEEYWYN